MTTTTEQTTEIRDYVLDVGPPGISWPGLLDHRHVGTRPGRGYATMDDAYARARRLSTHYAASGIGGKYDGPEIAVVGRDARGRVVRRWA